MEIAVEIATSISTIGGWFAVLNRLLAIEVFIVSVNASMASVALFFARIDL